MNLTTAAARGGAAKLVRADEPSLRALLNGVASPGVRGRGVRQLAQLSPLEWFVPLAFPPPHPPSPSPPPPPPRVLSVDQLGERRRRLERDHPVFTRRRR